MREIERDTLEIADPLPVLLLAGFLLLGIGLCLGWRVATVGQKDKGRPGRDAKLKAKGGFPGETTREKVERISREVVKTAFDEDIDALPSGWRTAIHVDVLDAENDGEEAMADAAGAAFRYLAKRAKYTQGN